MILSVENGGNLPFCRGCVCAVVNGLEDGVGGHDGFDYVVAKAEVCSCFKEIALSFLGYGGIVIARCCWCVLERDVMCMTGQGGGLG